jgi:phosphopantothenoylcysteine decarboxylase/phosphopantothenate--cysteine ligase
MTDKAEELHAVPTFLAKRLLLVATGSLGATYLPFWVNWLRMAYPSLETRIVVTRSAQQFVTRGALVPLVGQEVLEDSWPSQPETKAKHVELARWPDLVVVHPASFSFVGRLALGLADTPVTLALQCTEVGIVLAPALPPGGAESLAYRRHRDALAERDNIAVVDPIRAWSATTRRPEATTAAPLPDVLRTAEALRARLAERRVATHRN